MIDTSVILELYSIHDLSGDYGIDDTEGLRKRALGVGVVPYTPAQCIATLGVEFPAASVAFGERFRGRRAEYADGRPDAQTVVEFLEKISDIYGWCFEAARESERGQPSRRSPQRPA